MNTEPTRRLNKGLVIEVRVDEVIEVLPAVEGVSIMLTMEAKSGRKARIRVQSTGPVKVSRLDRGHFVPIG